jgi:hypothetical protein
MRLPLFGRERRYHARMTLRQELFEMARAARPAVVSAVLGIALLTALTLPADARGGHDMGQGFAGHGPQGAGGRRHGNDNYIKAASEDRDKLLTTKLKSICRGC